MHQLVLGVVWFAEEVSEFVLFNFFFCWVTSQKTSQQTLWITWLYLVVSKLKPQRPSLHSAHFNFPKTGLLSSHLSQSCEIDLQAFKKKVLNFQTDTRVLQETTWTYFSAKWFYLFQTDHICKLFLAVGRGMQEVLERVKKDEHFINLPSQKNRHVLVL